MIHVEQYGATVSSHRSMLAACKKARSLNRAERSKIPPGQTSSVRVVSPDGSSVSEGRFNAMITNHRNGHGLI